jgi:3-oxoacyl-[acyl-carrier-protein] synthase II
MSRWKGEPSQACRPFDRRRDGWVPGEGAGILILEEENHARNRGARIYGELMGGGSGCDAMPAGGLDPEGSGTEVAIMAALEEAGLGPADVGHVNAHGSATKASDRAEARALSRVFSPRGVPVTALKGYMGNLVSGAGAVELICSLIAVNRGRIPAVLNCEQPEPEFELDLVLKLPRESRGPVFVNTNLTPHGQAAAVVVRGFPG